MTTKIKKSQTTRFSLRISYKLRGLLIRGAARRLLNSGKNIPDEIPSISLLVREILDRELGSSTDVHTEKALVPPNKTILMMHVRSRLQEALKADAKEKGVTQNKLLAQILIGTDLGKMIVGRSISVDDKESLTPCTFGVPMACRFKLYREIGSRMLSKKTGLGRSEFASISDVINELLASHYDLPLPSEAEEESYVDHEVISFIVTLPDLLHAKLIDYCDSESARSSFTSMNSTIVDWCTDASVKEAW